MADEEETTQGQDDAQTDESGEETQETIKVGDMELDQSELKELVSQGQRLKEIEEKQGQPVDDILKSWGKRGERIGEFKKELEEKEQRLEEYEKSLADNQGQQLSDEQKQQAKALIKDLLADEFITKEDYQTLRAGEKLLAQTNQVIEEAKEKDWPSTTEDELLEFMADPANPKDPEKAYKLMFEEELDKLKEEKLTNLKKKGMSTEDKSTAGSKQPKPKKVTKENLRSHLKEVLSRQG